MKSPIEELPWIDPETAFAVLFGHEPHAFWLDSSLVVPGLSRFSFMGAADGAFFYDCRERVLRTPDGVVRHGIDLFSWIDEHLAARAEPEWTLPSDFAGGLVGTIGYECKALSGLNTPHRSHWPDAALFDVDRFVAFDHDARRVYAVRMDGRVNAETWRSLSAPTVVGQPTQVDWHWARPRSVYARDIDECLKAVARGDTYEACLTTALETSHRPDPLHLYRVLRRINSAPFSAFLRFDDLAVACSSPERFLRLDRSRTLESKPIKGTRRRGRDPHEDNALQRDLQTSAKDRAENLMIVDLVRNDLGRVSEIGTVHVPSLMAVESYATVHQLVSTVRSRLRQDLAMGDAVRAAFPPGSMTGAPKKRTVEILDGLEGRARGIYSGALGYFSRNGTMDLNVVIRTAVVDASGCSIGVGGAIVALSDPEAEIAEIELKARALKAAVEQSPHDRRRAARARYVTAPTWLRNNRVP